MLLLNGFTTAESLEDALKQLYLIDAIDENGSITSIGQTMAGKRFPSYLSTITMLTMISRVCHAS